jgi:hypothetical protein
LLKIFNICKFYTGRDGSILARMSQNEFRSKVWEYYLKNIKRQDRKTQEGAKLLKSYSAWLAEYSSSNVEKVLLVNFLVLRI